MKLSPVCISLSPHLRLSFSFRTVCRLFSLPHSSQVQLWLTQTRAEVFPVEVIQKKLCAYQADFSNSTETAKKRVKKQTSGWNLSEEKRWGFSTTSFGGLWKVKRKFYNFIFKEITSSKMYQRVSEKKQVTGNLWKMEVK